MHDLWPQQCITFESRVLSTKSGNNIEVLSNLTSAWPKLTSAWTLTPSQSNALYFGQGSFLPNLVAIGHSRAIWPLVDSDWSLREFWPHYTGILLTNKIWWPLAIPKAIWPLNELWPLVGSLQRYALEPYGSTPYLHAKFQSHTSSHDETHSWIDTHRLLYLSSIDI